MRDVLLLVGEALAIIFVIQTAAFALDVEHRESKRPPTAAIALWLVVAVPSLAQLAWPSLLDRLQRDPHAITHGHEYWRLLTSMAVQDGGVAGTIFNLITLAIVATLGIWFWGPRIAIAVFVVMGVVFNLLGTAYDVSGAGNSGATFALGASVCGAVLIVGSGGLRVRAAATIGFGALLWAVGDIHGFAVVAGAAIGLAASRWYVPGTSPA